jgi:hypothetical protein
VPKGEAPAADPIALAEAELRALLGQRLIESGQVKTFYVTLSEIAKRILEAGFGVSTQEKTTPEILESLGERAAAGGAVPAVPRVRRFLEACDLVKFAKYIPAAQENDQAVADAFELLKQAAAHRRVPAESPAPAAAAPAG